MRWLMAELSHLSADERKDVLKSFAAIRDGLVTVVQKFVKDRTQADRIAWLMFCIGVGYQQLSAEMVFPEQERLSMQELMETFTRLLA
jgi:ribosome assembly protein YihI (activator of Der GTPase)